MTLPAILCLHGTGSNATIFTFQLSTLQSLLSQTFDFISISGPFSTVAGHGVLPFFAGAEPFFRWKSKSDDNIFSHEEIEPEVRELIQKTLRERDDWIGILGFSQGGRLAAGWLMEQEIREEEGMGEMGEEEGAVFKFGVFINTPNPPMSGVVYEKGEKEEGIKIRTPSLLVRGTRDQWFESCGVMKEKWFDEEAKMLEFDVDHRVSGNVEDVKIIAREILRLYLLATGVRGSLNR